MSLRHQILDMLELQDAMNTKVSATWKTDNFEWYRAAWIEAAEMMDHFGWKWWKKQTPDRDQVVLEIVDIWHFCLSEQLCCAEHEVIAAKIGDLIKSRGDQSLDQSPEAFRIAVETFAAATLANRSADLGSFIDLLAASKLGFNDLYKHYIGKNVLNFFRQDHGYKEGTYAKIWQGREDNEHLAEIVASEDAARPNYRDIIYQALKQRYHG